MANLSTSYLGLNLKNPLIAGSCGLTNSISTIKMLEEKGIGAIVIKSMFEEQINIETEKFIKTEQGEIKTLTKGQNTIINKRVYDYDEAYSYIYDYAKQNTLEKYLDYLKDVKKTVGIPVIASINCISNYDWYSFAKQIQDAGVDAIELNIYILPSDFRRTSEDNEKVYSEIVNQVKRYVSIPISVKIGYYFTSLVHSIQKLSQTGINGIVLFNRPYNADIDIENLTVNTGNIYSSPEEYNQTLRWVSILSGHLDCDLSASTGVHSYETVIKYLLAGANSVQLASALYKKGFDIIPDILSNMAEWMKKHNFEKVEDFRGKLSKINLENPAAIERVQFMKLYSGIE